MCVTLQNHKYNTYNEGYVSLVIGNIFKHLLQQCDVSYKCKLLSFTTDKTIFKNNVDVQKYLPGKG